MRRRWPTSLPGQIALLVAIALFVAQAINFALLLRERRQLRLASATNPAIVRLIDASERLDAGRNLPADRPRNRVRLSRTSPIPAGRPEVRQAEEAIRSGLSDAGLRFSRVETALQPMSRDTARRRSMVARGVRRREGMQELLVAVEQPGRGWLTLSVPWVRADRGVVAQLIAQTLILYGIVLLAVFWIGHRIARPLRSLAAAARGFRPGSDAAPVREEGPEDVRSVIAAYNALGTRVTAMLDEKDRMLGAIGHDLRTPLAALRVRIESVEDEGDRARMADIIDEIARTLEDILSLARLGRSSEPPVEVDLAALVDAVVDDFRDLGADVTLDDVARLPVRLRPLLMRRAVRNLIENAVKYAGAAEVSVSGAANGGARVAVLDRGPGIPADRLDTVFDAFIRVETSRNRGTGGIGLGLALARAIVEEAGGTLTLANREGGGLAAVMLLPRGTPA
ncbi:Signal transduction histidine kinase [Sphingomonas guangdongensis]|uniref:histidine kinase n=1 Tax=Sphingomonas guangdongensis TaxID=1141890 RepID=A0A285R0W7_9SPHN|nr:HAMP domain-containing sensor histidine kinase [Sphingomonas guangdongensis]SOB87755.1 Signal transduction histidine kinase [Sphingomonas guangdongensis]